MESKRARVGESTERDIPIVWRSMSLTFVPADANMQRLASAAGHQAPIMRPILVGRDENSSNVPLGVRPKPLIIPGSGIGITGIRSAFVQQKAPAVIRNLLRLMSNRDLTQLPLMLLELEKDPSIQLLHIARRLIFETLVKKFLDEPCSGSDEQYTRVRCLSDLAIYRLSSTAPGSSVTRLQLQVALADFIKTPAPFMEEPDSLDLHRYLLERARLQPDMFQATAVLELMQADVERRVQLGTEDECILLDAIHTISTLGCESCASYFFNAHYMASFNLLSKHATQTDFPQDAQKALHTLMKLTYQFSVEAFVKLSNIGRKVLVVESVFRAIEVNLGHATMEPFYISQGFYRALEFLVVSSRSFTSLQQTLEVVEKIRTEASFATEGVLELVNQIQKLGQPVLSEL